MGSNSLSFRDTQPGVEVTEAVSSMLPSARGLVELLWHRSDAAKRAGSDGTWSALASEAAADPKVNAERKLLIAVLQQAEEADTKALRQRMLRAAQSAAGYVPPLTLFIGELSFAFDAANTLKATATALAPHAIGNDKLAPVLKGVNELLAAAWMQASEDAARNLTAKLRQAASEVDAVALDEEVRRALLRQRAYRQQTLFGEPHIVASLKPEGLSERIPCYIPADLSDAMPMFERFTAHLLAEAHMRQDQYASHDIALRAIALGRRVDLSAGSGGVE